MQLFLKPTASLLLVLVVCGTVVHSLGGRVFHAGQEKQDKMFVSDPSAKVDGIFKKEGDMTFILHSDPFADDYHDSNEEGGRRKRNAVLNTNYLWSDAIVPYEISTVFNEKERLTILSAMRHWEEKTCIRFRPKNSGDSYYVVFMSGPSGVCQSFVGRISQIYQPQGITLGQYCVYLPTIVHEIGHAIGFYHEHNRPDRDEHIEIIYNNIEQGLAGAFSKVKAGVTNLLGYGYDYASVMHYSEDAFSANGRNTIRAKDPTIPFGDAEELSPLDISKANKLYSCGAKSTWRPISIVLPSSDATPTLPSGITCGNVSNGQLSGTFTSPGFPNYNHSLHCAYVIKVPQGYYMEISLKNFAIEESSDCLKDYVRLYFGTELTFTNVVRFAGRTSREGNICDNGGYTYTYTLFSQVVTVLFHTDASGSGTRGLEVSFTAKDEDECQYTSGCQECKNLPGTFECTCRDGYYRSVAAATCYDVNECAYENGGCEHNCKNSGGSYECSCNTGYFLQSDNKSCSTTPPVSKCGDNLTAASGTFQTPNWPQTYHNNTDCEWLIHLPDASKLVEVTCGAESPYGIAGTYPDCTKDYIKLYDGYTIHNDSHGPYCGFTTPGTVQMSTNLAKIIFHAGPTHSSSRVGVKCTFRSINATLPATTTPPTTPPSSQCGGILNSASGSFQTPNWPETYPNNIDCEWRITLPESSKLIEIECEDNPFGIAGTLPACAKDYLKVYDGHSTQDTLKGTFCYYTKPDTMTTSSNMAMVVFHAGVRHSSSRKGFRCTFKSVNAPTLPPTLPPTTPPQCGGTLTAASGSFQTPNWPQTYPVDVTCDWTIELPDASKRVEITFKEGFGIAGSLPSCVKDHVHVIDDNTGTQYGPFCHYSVPPTQIMSSNKATVELYAGPAHSSSRRGFSATYRSV